MSGIQDRKKDHVELTVTDQTQYAIPAGFSDYGFIHNALPEVNVNEVSTEVKFLDRTFAYPLFISSMTGGYAGSEAVNAIIAEFCEQNRLPFGVGSQRAMLEYPEETQSFSIVREKAPNTFIAANIGGAQLIGGLEADKIDRLISSIQADAIIVHLNPLQELMQPEGDRNFIGIKKGIEDLLGEVSIPVIVKETGAGISREVASFLIEVGVKVIDVAGAGGTSWAKVENERNSNTKPLPEFNNWGLPTVKAIQDVAELKWENSFELIASGGIRNAFDTAKALCMGSNMVAMAQPIIKAIHKGGINELQSFYEQEVLNMRYIMTLLGCTYVHELSSSHIYKIQK